MHGAPAYGRYPTGGPQKQWPEGISGRPRQPKRLSAGAGQEVLVGFACPDAKRPRKRLHGAQRRRAPNATHSVVWGTSVRQTIQIIAYFSAQTVISRSRSRSLGRLCLPRRQAATQEAPRSPTPARAKRYAQCGLGDKCAPNHTNHCIFFTSKQHAKMSPQTERAKRYTHCHFGHKALQNEHPPRPAQSKTYRFFNTPTEPPNENIKKTLVFPSQIVRAKFGVVEGQTKTSRIKSKRFTLVFRVTKIQLQC